MEFLIELIAEVFLQGLGDILFDWLLRSKNPALRTLGISLVSAMVGGILGAFSLLVFKSHLIGWWELRVATLIVLPILNGFVMSHIGQQQIKHEKSRSAFEYFIPAFFFSLAFGLVRFLGAVNT